MLFLTLYIERFINFSALFFFKSKKILILKINMNAAISIKQIILGLHQDGKNMDEIQSTLMLMFEDDLITSTEII
jgi:hypothetical protein